MSETTTVDQLNAVLKAASASADAVRWAPPEMRATWMKAVADALDEESISLVELAASETGLSAERLGGELARTTGQLRFLATHTLTGAPFEPTIDTADPAWSPTPRPDLRAQGVSIGVVLNFAASNFPFAFSVTGGDTAAAWAAGCPVVVKAHPGHPLLSERVAKLATQALAGAGAPAGFFALVQGYETGIRALQDERISAGAFTGSVAGGRALYDIATARPVPIPFFAEMGSINPVVITQDASHARADEIANGLTGSFLLGCGQFCTKPGFVLLPTDSPIISAVARIVEGMAPGRMLTEPIRDRHRREVERILAQPGVRMLASGTKPDPSATASETPSVLVTTTAQVLQSPDDLTAEAFGPSILLVTYENQADLNQVLALLPGALTATVQRGEKEDVSAMLLALSEHAGRVLVNDWPTGVAVTWAQHHGGPYPSTSDSRATSVGAAAVGRFLRRVAFQNAPNEALPPLLRDEAVPGVLRSVDGRLTSNPVVRTGS